MNFEMELLKTFSKPKKGKGKVSLHILLSTLGVGIGVLTLIIVMAAFDGYVNTLETLLLSTTPHVQIKKNLKTEEEDEVDELFGDILEEEESDDITLDKPRFYDTDEDLETVEIEEEESEITFSEKNLFTEEEIKEVIPFTHKFPKVGFSEEAIVSSRDFFFFSEDGKFLLRTTSMIYASSFHDSKSALEIDRIITDKEVFKQLNKITPGSEIGGILLTDSIFKFIKDKGINIGQNILLSTTENPESANVVKTKILSSFSYGLESDSAQSVVTDLSTAKKLFNTGNGANTISIRLKNRYEADIVAEEINKNLPKGFYTVNWIDMTKRVFNILKVLKAIIFVTLLLIIVVASFSIKNSLAMIVLEKRKQIAVLKAIGAKNSHVYKAFFYLSIGIGSIGMIVGMLLGIFGMWIIQNFQSGTMNEILGVTQLNFQIQPLVILYLYFSLLLICIFSALSPSRKAATIMPVEGMR